MITIDDIKINYTDEGRGKNTLVFLHGWGQNINMMDPVATPFKKNNRVIIIDLPGFGHSEEPKTVYTVYDYASCVNKLLNKLKATNITLIGHSFGGKIALVYATKYDIKKLVLLASPYKKERKDLSLKEKLMKKMYQISFLKKLGDKLKKHIGSTDYKNSSEMMRKVLVSTVNTEIKDEISKITVPTIIIWGTDDKAVPYSHGEELSHLIKDAGLITYEGGTHYAYLERLEQTINIIKSFITDKEL